MQKIIVIAIVFLLGHINFYAQDKNTLIVEFSGMKSDKGKLFVALYNKESEFLKKPFKGVVIEIKNKKAKAIFKEILAGEYAVSSFHDENDNKKMDTNFLGIPKEPIGVSNDAKGFMGPPKYKDAKFEVKQNEVIKIQVN